MKYSIKIDILSASAFKGKKLNDIVAHRITGGWIKTVRPYRKYLKYTKFTG